MERLFEPPSAGKMSPVAKVVVYTLLAFWSVFVIFPIYWVVITSLQGCGRRQPGPVLYSLRGFPAHARRMARASSDPNCDLYAMAGSSCYLRVGNHCPW
jgi:multiple sugar transport system permease protein